MVNGSAQSQDIIFEKDQPSISGDRLVIVHNTPQVHIGVGQPIIEVSQITGNNAIDQVI